MIKCPICGMIINENNYNFNESAFLNKNEKENIIYCPFCGVSSEYLDDSKEYLNQSVLIQDENIKMILDHAMKLEVFNYEFYEKASELAKDSEIKKLFMALSKIELMHAKIHQKLGNFNELPKLTPLDYSKYNDESTLLKMAVKREEHAVKYYERYAPIIKNEIVSEILNALKKVETEHILLETENIK